jgi:hypothetical protein
VQDEGKHAGRPLKILAHGGLDDDDGDAHMSIVIRKKEKRNTHELQLSVIIH